MTRWLVTGAGGMLGQDLTGLLRAGGEDFTGFDRAQLDITDASAVAAAVQAEQPDIVVNCAAWTAVDDAESREDRALAVNGAGAAHLAAACARVGARLVHPSTDYVFSGSAAQPYPEDCPPDPRTAYGRTKLAGEQAVLGLLPGSSYVLRTAWLYGAHGPNFVAVVDDQHGQPTWTGDVASQIVLLARSGAAPGIYHASASGATTWYGLARAVFGLLGADPGRVRPATTSEMPRPAPRPAYSVLGHARWASTGLPPLPDWEDALRAAFPSIAAAEGRHPVSQGSG
jgi:dTDP-4-dehydrorhamnose reductase